MDKALLKKTIDDWQEVKLKIFQLSNPRLNKITKPTNDIGKALIGVRRSGKTTSSIKMFKDHNLETVLYYNFEDPLFYPNAKATDIENLISVAEEYSKVKIEVLIFDEIQNVDGWERSVRKIIDSKKYKVVVTGSSSKLLSKELATAIAGRAIEKIIWPLSFKEFLLFKNLNLTQVSNSHFREYLMWGGFPEVVLAKEEERLDILNQYFSDIVLKDIINRNQIRNKRSLDMIVNYYYTNLSSLHSYSSIKKAFSLGVDTVLSYTRMLSEAFLIFEVERFHHNLKVQSRDPKKVYVIDNGLRKIVARSINDDLGKLLENLIYLELRRQNKKVMYFKQKQEVDFLILENYIPIQAIQVTASNLEDEKTYNREVTAILECIRECRLEKGIILTWDREEKIKIAGKIIEFIPAYKWLLDSSL